MKKAVLLVMSVSVITLAYAQKKPKINKANAARERGELAEAKEIIDLAIDYEKTKDDGKTWYYRGLIYATIDTTSNPQYSSLSDNALEIAVEAFAKADELGDKDKEYFIINASGFPQTKSQQIEGYFGYYFNTGVEGFQENDYEKAFENFEMAAVITPADTNSLKNAAYAAHSGEMTDEAIEYYTKSIDAGAISNDLFMNAIYLLSAKAEDNEGALAVAEKGLEVYPSDPTLMKNKINLLIKLDRLDAAIEDLKVAIAAEPDEVNLIFNLAAMHEQTGDIEKAKQTYDQAIAVNPDHYESNFNKGVLLLNDANEAYKEMSNLGISKADKAKAKQLEPIIKEKYQKALPQWERMYKIAPDDRQVVETLTYIYGRLKMREKENKFYDILESMPESE